jgi:hypothetical protein
MMRHIVASSWNRGQHTNPRIAGRNRSYVATAICKTQVNGMTFLQGSNCQDIAASIANFRHTI